MRNLRRNLNFTWCQKMLVRFELPATVHHHAHYRVGQKGGYDLNIWSEKKCLECSFPSQAEMSSFDQTCERYCTDTQINEGVSY
jgi:hypothetical protein